MIEIVFSDSDGNRRVGLLSSADIRPVPAGIDRGNSPDIIFIFVDPAAGSTVRNLFFRHARGSPVATGDIFAFFPDFDLYHGMAQKI